MRRNKLIHLNPVETVYTMCVFLIVSLNHVCVNHCHLVSHSLSPFLPSLSIPQTTQNSSGPIEVNVPQMPKNNTNNGISPIIKPWVRRLFSFTDLGPCTHLEMSIEPCYSKTLVLHPLVRTHGSHCYRTGSCSSLFADEKRWSFLRFVFVKDSSQCHTFFNRMADT